MTRFLHTLKRFDLPLLITSMLVLIMGLAVLYGLALGEDSLVLFWRQLIFAGVAIVAFFSFSLYNYHTLSRVNRIVYIILVLALLGLLIFGRPIRGSARWIDIGFFNLQPAELAKAVVLIGLARFLSIRRGQINSIKNILITLLYSAVPAVLILLEPDLGSSLVVVAIWFGMLIISPLKKKYIAAILIAGIVAAGIGWQFFLQDYQKTRVESIINPSLDPRGKGYNVRQALIAVGNGGLVGQGLGQGLQSQLKFLPERQTDFIFASSAEEVGFVGSTFIIVLYFFLLYRLLKIMRRAKDGLGYYMVGGIFIWFAMQIGVNIGMNMGLMPVTGLPLPMMSYGGSSLLASGIALGIAQNVAQQSKILHQ